MAKRESLLDGLTTVEAVRRARPGGGGPKFGESRTHLPAADAKRKPKESEPPAPVGHIGHTVIPGKTEIICPECGYTWTLGGKIVKTYCPKCRKILEAIDQVIEGEWTGTLKTIGAVDVKPGSVVKDSQIAARAMVLAGRVERSQIRVFCRLELCRGAEGDLAAITTRDLVIRAGGRFAFAEAPASQRIEVEGELRGRIVTDGLLIVRAGGCLSGEISAPRLVVEEGGGLKGRVEIGPRSAKS